MIFLCSGFIPGEVAVWLQLLQPWTKQWPDNLSCPRFSSCFGLGGISFCRCRVLRILRIFFKSEEQSEGSSETAAETSEWTKVWGSSPNQIIKKMAHWLCQRLKMLCHGPVSLRLAHSRPHVVFVLTLLSGWAELIMGSRLWPTHLAWLPPAAAHWHSSWRYLRWRLWASRRWIVELLEFVSPDTS